MLYKRITFFAAVALTVCCMATSLVAQSDSSADMLRKIDSQVSFDGDFSAEYTITTFVPGEGETKTVAAMFRRDSADKYLILILEPVADKGKGYLKMDNNLWFYDPIGKRFTFTSSKERFQNHNARNSDFTRSNLAADYRVQATSKEKVGAFDCTVLDLTAIRDGVTYPRTKIWVDKDLLVRKTEDYSLSNQLLRVTAISGYQQVGKRFVPQSIVILDALAGKKIDGKLQNERTRIDIKQPSLQALPDSIYSKAYLEKVSK